MRESGLVSPRTQRTTDTSEVPKYLAKSPGERSNRLKISWTKESLSALGTAGDPSCFICRASFVSKQLHRWVSSVTHRLGSANRNSMVCDGISALILMNSAVRDVQFCQ